MVITNAGPLMALGRLGLLELLPSLYGEVRLPTAVHSEVVIRGRERGYLDALLVQRAIQRGQLIVVEVNDAELPPDVAGLHLDTGEKQVLWLALREKADLVVFDDLKAREEAQGRGLAVKGTLGVIVQAQRVGLLSLDEAQTSIEAIIDADDIWIAEGLCRQVLAKLKGTSTGGQQ
jgi:predicted nucleic acid-binding protein